MTQIKPTDINKYITTIRINFENAYKTQNDEEREILIKSWYAILKDYPKEIVDKAVINAIKNAEFAPRIGSIVKEIEKMYEAYEKSDEELWAELTGVLRSVSNNKYRYRFTAIAANGKTQGENALLSNKAIFDGLSGELKLFCQNLDGLEHIAEYSAEQLNFERGRFLRTIPTIKQREKTKRETGDQLQALIYGMQALNAIECNETIIGEMIKI